MPDRRWDVFCVADLCADLILTGNVVPRFQQFEQLIDDYSVEPGGSATIFASQFAKLGGRVGLIGAVGADAFGDFLLRQLEAIGIDCRRVRRETQEKTGLGVHLMKSDGDRAMLTYSGTIDATPPEALTDDLLADVRHWHLASLFLLGRMRGCWKGWLARCRASGLTTSMDTNWDPADRWEGARDLLPLIDVFLPNEAEACAIAGVSDVEQAGEALSELGPLIVIKQGAAGATAYHRGRRWHVASTAPGPIVDTVGAGDTFDAGFLRGWLLGWSVEECLRLAARCAGHSLCAAGGVRGQIVEEIA